jgi:hypothetical protein
MNLCGGIANVGGGDQLLLEIPDEKFQLTPRRNAASSTPSRRHNTSLSAVESTRRTPSSALGRSRASQSPNSAQSPTFLNPISKNDLKKSVDRQRSGGQSMLPSKMSSLAIKNLEAGYIVVSIFASWGPEVQNTLCSHSCLFVVVERRCCRSSARSSC